MPWNGEERRNIKVEVTKEQFQSMDVSDQLWTILETFASQVQTCNGRFTVIEQKQGWFRTIAIVGLAYLAGLGVVKSGVIVKWITGVLF